MHSSIEKYLNRAETIRKLAEKYENLEITYISRGSTDSEELVVKTDYSKATGYQLIDNEDYDRDLDLGDIFLILTIEELDELILVQSNVTGQILNKICSGSLSVGIPGTIHDGSQQCWNESNEDYDKRSIKENLNFEDLRKKLISLGINEILMSEILGKLKSLMINEYNEYENDE